MKEQRFKSVWDAIENSPPAAANMRARSDVMIAIRKVVDGWSLTQAEAAKRLGITQPRLNDFLRGRIDNFSLDALMNLATRAGLSVRVKVARPTITERTARADVPKALRILKRAGVGRPPMKGDDMPKTKRKRR